MTCEDCDCEPCVCAQSCTDDAPDRDSSCSDSEQPDCCDSGEDDDSGEEDRGAQGFQGPPGPSGISGGLTVATHYARFYGLTTFDERGALVIPNGAVPFPNQSTIVGSAIQRVSVTEFLLKQVGSYLVRFLVTTLQAGQLQLQMGENYDIKRTRHETEYKMVESSTATNQNCVSGGLLLIGEDVIRVEKGNNVIRLVNPASNVDSVLQIAGSNTTSLKQPRVHWISIQKLD